MDGKLGFKIRDHVPVLRKKTAILLFSFLSAAFGIIFFMLNPAGLINIFGLPKSNFYQPSQVCLSERCYGVELALTSEERARGLMFRKNLDADKGMLFIFEKPGFYGFWMKNTLIPLDIIWIDNDRKIVFISKKTRPCGLENCPITKPDNPARYVLEINSGQADIVQAKVGDTVTFK